MHTVRELPNEVFKSKAHAFEALKRQETRLIKLKCSQVYKSCDKLQGFKTLPFLNKSFSTQKNTPEWFQEGNIYPIINTTKYYDSHGDVHFDGIWDRSLKANVGKLYYVEDHSLKINDIIAWPETVKSFVKMVDWSMVGKTYEGQTQALIYEIPKEVITHKGALEVLDNNRPIENSVRMQYVKMNLAINSSEDEFKENKEIYDSRIESIANKEEAERDGYFWAVDEAKIFKEGSMVIAGSNDATSIYSGPADSTPEQPKSEGPSKDTLDKQYFDNLI